jgi:crotonobetainyl-CoA:carnitine CoA-transferase CaiB-like acyl-CoA transferase
VSGFGHNDEGERKAFDTVIQAYCGIMHLTGYPDHLPVKLGISAIDVGAALGAAAAALAGLNERAATGAGMHIDLAMFDIAVWMTQAAWPDILSGGSDPGRSGNRNAKACPHDVYPGRTGLLALTVESDEEWLRLAATMLRPDLAEDTGLASLAGRLERIDEIDDAVIGWLASHEADEAAAQLQAGGVPAAPVRDMAAIAEAAETRLRGLVVETTPLGGGPIRVLGNPINFSRTTSSIRAAAPTLGEHTETVLTEWLGVSSESHDAASSLAPAS